MKKYIIVIILITALFVTGCRTGNTASDSNQNQPSVQGDGSAPEFIDGLIRDQYDGLEFSVEVLERKAILPGTVFQATVLVENKGDKTINYIQGSGSFTTPEALSVFSDSLQTILPEDHLGVMTMDFVTDELKPGDSLLFRFNVMTIAPDPDFATYTHDLFNEGTYIADMDLASLQDRFPSLTAVAPGSYTLKAYFLYTVPEEGGGEFDFMGGATGYAVAETVINVT